MKIKFLCAILIAVLSGAGPAARAANEDMPWRNPALSAEERAQDLVSRLTLEEKISLLTYTFPGIPRLGIDHYFHGNEALHGIVRPGNFTVFPQAIALAATWNPDLIRQMTTAASDEARARNNALGGNVDAHSSGLLTFWSPTVNMARDPRWGRTPETYGEDPYLTSRIGVAFVKGLQGDDPHYVKVVSTPKHFAANNEEHNRLRCNAKISEPVLREYYLRGFQACIQEGGAQSIMGAYNAVNGVPCNANDFLLEKVLRGDWGFDGYVVTDCGALDALISQHKYVKSGPEAAAAGINNGVDLECGGAEVFRNHLGKAVAQGLVTEDTVTQAAYRVLRGRFRLGFFDPPDMVPYTKIPETVIGSKEHQALALRIARESMVLLKNDARGGAPMLPLDLNEITSIAVMGPNAGTARFGDYSGSPVNEAVSPADGIRNRSAGRAAVNYVAWTPPAQSGYTLAPADAFRNGNDNGLKTEYFNNPKFEGAPAVVRTDAGVDVDTQNKPPDPAVPNGRFAVRWRGTIAPQVTGEYKISLNTDGRVRLAIDGRTLIERKEKEMPKFTAGKSIDLYVAEQYDKKRIDAPVLLEAGRSYDMVLEYAHKEGHALCRLEWIPPAADLAVARAKDMEAARTSDVVVAVMGIGLDDEREGKDRDNLDLPFGQTEYVMQLLEANPSTVVVIVGGSSLAINWIQDNAPAIIEAWYPGEQGGSAVADVLFGNINPGGRLPLTFYKSMNDLPAFDDYDITNNRTYMYFPGEPLYPFGYGLSFTTFAYANLRAGAPENGVVPVTVDVTNTGARAGDEVVQVYVKQTVPGDRKIPAKQLAAFQRVSLNPGETRTVSLPVSLDTIKLWNDDNKQFELMAGSIEVQAGASSADIRLTAVMDMR